MRRLCPRAGLTARGSDKAGSAAVQRSPRCRWRRWPQCTMPASARPLWSGRGFASLTEPSTGCPDTGFARNGEGAPHQGFRGPLAGCRTSGEPLGAPREESCRASDSPELLFGYVLPALHGSRDPAGRTTSCVFLPWPCLQNTLDGPHDLLPLSRLVRQFLPPSPREPVIARAPIVIRGAPLGSDEPSPLQPL